MLYDQGQLVATYLEAYQLSGEVFFADIARDVLEYVLREMTGPAGQFYSAEDADSPLPNNPQEQAEGAFYVWEHHEIIEALGEEIGPLFCDHYGVEKSGNAPSDPHGEFRNKNILIIRQSVAATAEKFGKTEEETRNLLAAARATLFDRRAQRPRPHLDDKTLTAWNGLMISAFAQAAQVLGEERYYQAAQRAAAFVRGNLYQESTGRLLRRYRDGDAAIDAYVDDYAYLVQGLLDLYEAGFDPEIYEWAVTLQEKQQDLFYDHEAGGYYTTTGTDPSVLLRMKEDYDGAEPSPNSISVLNLLRLAQMTGDERYPLWAEQTLSAFCLAPEPCARSPATNVGGPDLLADQTAPGHYCRWSGRCRYPGPAARGPCEISSQQDPVDGRWRNGSCAAGSAFEIYPRRQTDRRTGHGVCVPGLHLQAADERPGHASRPAR